MRACVEIHQTRLARGRAVEDSIMDVQLTRYVWSQASHQPAGF